MLDLHKLLLRAAQRADLPADIAAGLPRMEVNGFSECSFDLHRGILAYREDEIDVLLTIGVVRICGSGLALRQMHRDRLSIVGSICSITFLGGEG